MDSNSEDENVGHWVDDRMGRLGVDSEWDPNADAALAGWRERVQRKARGPSWIAAAATISISALIVAVLVILGPAAERLWERVSPTGNDSEPAKITPAHESQIPSTTLSPPEPEPLTASGPQTTKASPPPEPAPLSSAVETATPPRVIHRVEPGCTEEARRNTIDGTVVLALTIYKDGAAAVTRVVRSLGYGLDESATEALRQWRFEPATRNGEPVDVNVNVEVNFKCR